MEPIKVVEILQRARQKLVESPWVKGKFERTTKSGKTGYCALGAVRAVADGVAPTGIVSALDRATRRIAARHGLKFREIIRFNDARVTTKKHVIAVFDSAIRAAKRAKA